MMLALQVMHSQSVEYAVDSMDVDSAANLLVAAAWLPNNSVTLVAHSLHADSFFAYKVRPFQDVIARRRWGMGGKERD